MSITLDYSNMVRSNVSGALDDALLREGEEAFARALEVFAERERAGELGFLELPDSDPAPLLQFAEGAGQAFADVVVLGIGGSALGPIALRTAIRSATWNLRSDEAREFFPRLHVLENVDPASMIALLQLVEPGRTLFVVVSKSGGTAETMAQYLVVREHLQRSLGEHVHRHLVFVTDPEKGALRAVARSEGIVSMEIPSNVGGRFSVLSPVGLLPAALIGIDVTALLQGAAHMAERCRNERFDSNPAAVFAVLQWLADTRLGLGTQVLMPYSDALRDVSAWFVQLWAESLGKLRADGTSVGPTPLSALGVTDQHSQVQLFMEGPRNKTVTFLAVLERAFDVPIPLLHEDQREMSYLGGHTLGELLDAERRATTAALAQRGRPSMTIELERMDAWHLGGLFMLFQMATVFAGALYDVNPLDQPGVELGKKYTFALMNRPDAEDARREWEAIPSPEPRRVE